MMVTRGQVYDLMMLPGLVAVHDTNPVGLLTYHLSNAECEIITLNSWQEGEGIGTQLIQSVQTIAHQSQCRRIFFITTNDNLAAQRFYQRRGFVVKAIYPNAIEISRMLKPEIPLVSLDGIPITDEIEFEMPL